MWSWKCKSDLLFPVVPECTGSILPPSHPSPTRLPSPSSGAVGSTEVRVRARGIMGRGQRLQGEGRRGTVHGTQGPHVVSSCKQTAHQPEHSPGGGLQHCPECGEGPFEDPRGLLRCKWCPEKRYSPPPSSASFPPPPPLSHFFYHHLQLNQSLLPKRTRDDPTWASPFPRIKRIWLMTMFLGWGTFTAHFCFLTEKGISTTLPGREECGKNTLTFSSSHLFLI